MSNQFHSDIQSDIDFVLLNKQVANKQEIYKFVCSDSTLNRNGWEIMTSGIKLDNYKKNPVLLYNHDTKSPIGKCINIYVDGDKLIGEFVFHEHSELAITSKKLVDGGFLTSVSIGATILKRGNSKPIKQADKDKYGSWRQTTDVFESVELTEISLVSVPANTSAQFIEKINNSFRSGNLTQNEYRIALGQTLIATNLTNDVQNILKNGIHNESIQALLDKVDDVLDNEFLTEQEKSQQTWELYNFLKNNNYNSEPKIQRILQIIESCVKK